MDGIGHDDRRIGRLPRVGPGHVGPRTCFGLPVRPARVRLLTAGVARRRRVGIWLARRCLQLGGRGHHRSHGPRGGMVRVRPDHLLLPGAARLRGQHARLRHRSGTGQQRPLHRCRHHRLVLGGCPRVLPGGGAGGPAFLERDGDRDVDPRGNPRRPRHRLSLAGKPLGRAHERATRPACVERHRQHRPDRQQLLHLCGHRDQCGARRRAPEPGTGLSQVDLPRHGAGPRRLHPSDPGDRLGDPLGPDQLHRWGDAGLRQPADSLRPEIRRARDRRRPGHRRAGGDDGLAGRPIGGAAADRPRAGLLAALLPEGQRQGHRGAHPDCAGCRDHRDRPALCLRSERLARLLDLRRHGHTGLPDHVRAHVHRGTAATSFATRPPAWLPRSGPRPVVPARHGVIGGGARHRVRPALAVPPVEPGPLRRTHRCGHPGHRGPAAVPVDRFRKPTWKMSVGGPGTPS